MTTSIDFFPSEYGSSNDSESAPGTHFAGNFSGSISAGYGSSNPSYTSFEDEPPLWEELGIEPDRIRQKLWAALNPRNRLEPQILHDTDLGGPFIICIVLGCCLMLGGKLHFGYLFGYSALGSATMYLLINLMSEPGIGFTHTMSVLGYCLLPMVVLALVSLFVPPTTVVGFLVSVAIIAWCTNSASSMFVKVASMAEQFFLLAYPIGMLYACFALICMF
eukprot:TRINITY_DN665_c0_g1_i1.p1 TRINITY_DN665_c0_g1~~TRINITY_DN665_c0_g1_i1.p1  ORF type:complete len:220 (-),score=63.72 TRINITY_DN665_c0_g1_i1:304-963(-)